MKSFELIPLAAEISKQPSINYVEWLLVITLTKIYKENEKAEHGKFQNINFEEKEYQEVEWS